MFLDESVVCFGVCVCWQHGSEQRFCSPPAGFNSVCGFVQDSQSKQGGYSMHQLQGNKEFGSEKKGYLLKKSDG